MDNGRSITKDPETGLITGATLDSDTACEMAARRRTKDERIDDAARSLVEELGYQWEEAPAQYKTLARQAASEKGGSVAAHRLLLQIARKLPKPGESVGQEWRPGDPYCPACGGRSQVIVQLSEEVGVSVLKLLGLPDKRADEDPYSRVAAIERNGRIEAVILVETGATDSKLSAAIPLALQFRDYLQDNGGASKPGLSRS